MGWIVRASVNAAELMRLATNKEKHLESPTGDLNERKIGRSASRSESDVSRFISKSMAFNQPIICVCNELHPARAEQTLFSCRPH